MSESGKLEGFKALGERIKKKIHGRRRSACRAFGASHHPAEGARACGGGLAAGLAGEKGGLIDIGH